MIGGVDEAGRGPVMGPMVVAAIGVDDQSILKTLGVKDSKLLGPDKRTELAADHLNTYPHSILIVPACCIDEARKTMTMNKLEVIAFSTVISSLITGAPIIHPLLPVDCVVEMSETSGKIGCFILDAADVKNERFAVSVERDLREMIDGPLPAISAFHRADNDHPVVGAASILAKVKRDGIIADISSELGVNIGSGYPGDPVTRSFLRGWVDEKGDLPPHSRKTWETCRKLIGRSSQISLDRF